MKNQHAAYQWIVMRIQSVMAPTVTSIWLPRSIALVERGR